MYSFNVSCLIFCVVMACVLYGTHANPVENTSSAPATSTPEEMLKSASLNQPIVQIAGLDIQKLLAGVQMSANGQSGNSQGCSSKGSNAANGVVNISGQSISCK
ncbi:unnamed protein product [Adineta ricciae]|uniref:Uncharacterized protein n=1 Tax=Adineta ricciae TaxID=249248 RepID=A0A814QYK4_ADIRI|nr:unnamed protein product [Adineta ricciae]CAF1125960.1 unnamed protein product [Adineta ricciae]